MRSDTRFDSILWGCFLAIIQNTKIAEKIMPSRAMTIWLAVSASILAFCFVYRNDAFRETWRYSLQGFALMPVFYYSIEKSHSLAFRWLNWKPLVRIGVWSYSIYLIHYVILSALKFYDLRLSAVTAFLIAAVGGIIYAAILERYVEMPVRAIRNKITGHNRLPRKSEESVSMPTT